MSRFLTDTLEGIEIIRAKDVKKHGEHDQSSHGAWATGESSGEGLSEETAAKIQQFTRDWKGLSIKMTDGSLPDKGYMVSKPTKFSRIVPAKDFYDPKEGWKILREYEKKHSEDLATGKNYLGTWEHEGKVFLDVSQNIMDRDEAVSLGRNNDQLKIWDVVNQKEIDTGGTGGIKKASQDDTNERYLGNDRGRERRLRKGTLGKNDWDEGRRRTKVIYFDFGLKPVLKHGEHDQSDHGLWALGYTEEERSRIEGMKDKGPAREDIDKVISGKREVSDDEIRMYVENDRYQYESAIDGIDERIDERLSNLQEEFPNHEYTEQEKSEIYENVQREMIDEYIESSRDELEEMVRGESGDEIDADELTPLFDEVYGISHTGTNPAGEEHTLTSTVYGVSEEGGNLFVQGVIQDENNEEVGVINRRFFEKDGVIGVEHQELILFMDEHKGTGFGKEVIKQSEAWYVARGIGFIEVGTAMDGARHWARAGYDWKPDRVEENLQKIAVNIEEVEGFERGTPARAEFDALMARATDGYEPNWEDESGNKYPAWDSVKDMKTDNFPLPADFANIGYTKGATEWAGKSLMDGLKMKYVKVLTAEGQKLMDGPIDHDGDGMIYDGTAREKPAPGGGKKD